MNKRMAGLTLAAFIATAGAANARPFSIDDLPKIVGVTDVAISPDGKEIVYIVSRANMKNDNFDRSLNLYDVATKSNRQVSYDRKELSSPQWAPDGTRIAFLAQKGDGRDAKQQIFVMDMRGGDPQPITDTHNGVQQFKWRPDGAAIAYVTSDDAPNKEAIEKKHLDGFVVGDQAFNTLSSPTANHIWIVNADGTNGHRLTSGTWSVPSAQPPSSPGAPISWSPDGKSITFTKMPNPYDADGDMAVVAVVEVASGAIRTLTSHGKYEGFSEYSPDGEHISYWYPHNGNESEENDVFVAPASGGNGVDVTAEDIDTNVQRAMWMPDGKSLLISGHKETDAALWLKPLNGKAQRLNLGQVQPTQAYWLDASVSKTGAITFTGSEAGHPTELYYMASANAVPQRLTNLNDELAKLDLGTVKPIQWSFEGFSEDGTVTLPPGYDSNKTYPLVLVIHGGPNSASIVGFSALNQLIASHGYVVFNPNYRGSDNLGAKYWYAIINDAGAGPGRDVMAGIDAVEKSYKIDSSRIAVSGWSYGGYMTSWMEGHYHIWKTAVAGAAVNNWIDEYNLSDNSVGVRYQFKGSPYVKDYGKDYWAQSPISAAWQITTPTLILSDVGDSRVPITQSYEMFRALTNRGTPVKFFAYPVGGHFPGDPVRSQDVDRRWVQWIVDYLK